jgi:ABC-type sugar transport system ATPase subunit
VSERLPVLAVDGVTKRFGAVTALRNVSLELRAGEVLGIIGDNGAGKSTLVGVVSGALRPDEGRLAVDGVERTFSDPAEARAVGIETVFQNLALVPTLNIAENLYLRRELLGPGPVGKALHRLHKSAMRREAREAFDRFGVTLPPVKTKVSALSGGQRQAVAITRAVLWGSHIVIMDEPAAALGVRQSMQVLAFIRMLSKRGIAVLFISHNMQHVLRVTDRIVVLRHGEKVGDLETATTSAGEIVTLITGSDLVVPGQEDAV